MLAHRVQKLNRHRLLCGFWVWHQSTQRSRIATEQDNGEVKARRVRDAEVEHKVLQFRIRNLEAASTKRYLWRWSAATRSSRVAQERLDRHEREHELEEEHEERLDSVVAKFARVHSMRMAMVSRVSQMRLFYRWANVVHSKRWYVAAESASNADDTLRCTVQFTRVLLRSTVLGRDARVNEARLVRSMLEWRMSTQFQRMHREKMFAKDKGYAAMAVRSKAVDAISLRGAFIAWRFGSMTSTSNYKLARLMAHVNA